MSGWIQGENGNLDTKISEEKESAKNIQFSHVAVPISHFGFRCPKFPHFGLWNSHLDFHRAKLSLSLIQLSSEGPIFLISAPNRKWFESLDSWLSELWNGIYNVENGLQKVLQKYDERLQLCPLFSSLCFPLLHCSFLAYFERLRQRIMRLQSLVSS